MDVFPSTREVREVVVSICLFAGSLDKSGKQIGVHHEYVFLFGVFDEKQSKYKQSGKASDDIKYTINGYTQGSLPG